MNKFTKIVLAVLGALFALCVIASFTACDQAAENSKTIDTRPTNPVPAPAPAVDKRPTISYDLPSGWKWLDKPEDLAIETQTGSKDGTHGFMKIEPEVRVGTDVDARSHIKREFDAWTKACSEAAADPESKCAVMPIYKELKIGDTTVYMAMDQEEAEGPLSWFTIFSFSVPGSNNGFIMNGIIYDRADLYTAEFTTIVNSLRIKQ